MVQVDQILKSPFHKNTKGWVESWGWGWGWGWGWVGIQFSHQVTKCNDKYY